VNTAGLEEYWLPAESVPRSVSLYESPEVSVTTLVLTEAELCALTVLPEGNVPDVIAAPASLVIK